jgi:hypothetical protein
VLCRKRRNERCEQSPSTSRVPHDLKGLSATVRRPTSNQRLTTTRTNTPVAILKCPITRIEPGRCSSPPPMKCDRAHSEVPPGAWVIRHPGDDRDHVHVAVMPHQRRKAKARMGALDPAGSEALSRQPTRAADCQIFVRHNCQFYSRR